LVRPLGSTKPYTQKKRTACVTLPNVLLDEVEQSMRDEGQKNLSAKLAEIIQFWLDHKDEIDGKGAADNDDLERFRGFSGSLYE